MKHSRNVPTATDVPDAIPGGTSEAQKRRDNAGFQRFWEKRGEKLMSFREMNHAAAAEGEAAKKRKTS